MSEQILQLENIKKEFVMGKSRLPVLRGVSLDVTKGELVSIMGPSGAGKTTLLNIAGGLMHPSSGSVTIDGDNLFVKSDEGISQSRNKNIGFVFQMHHLLPEFTAEENVMMPARIAGVGVSAALSRARELLREVGLGERLNHRPGELSGGEQQRVAIARALMNQPKLLLADEPTGDLDGPTAREIHHLFRQINEQQGQTVIMVTHNPELGALAGRTITIEDGRIV
ncbi:ABC transporter ATP-binding protein [bacterium]|nr:ABC transporter ATP-binding protein [bacterium]